MSSKNYNLSNYEYMLAGGGSGIFTRFTCQPFDVLKIRFQLQATPSGTNGAQIKYSSIYQAIRTIGKEEGIRAFWKGHIPAQWLSAFYGAAQFSTYEAFTKPWKKNSLIHFGAGALSGSIAVISSFPFDVIRTRLVAQGEPKIYHSMVDVGTKIIRLEGWSGLFKGMIPSIVHNAPLSALVFGFHHVFTSVYTRVTEREMSPLSSLGCGALSGFTAKFIMYPLDLIKKRLQIQGMPEGSLASGTIVRTNGVIHCFKVTLQSEGIRALYKGLLPTLLKSSLTNSIYLTSYDMFCKCLYYRQTSNA